MGILTGALLAGFLAKYFGWGKKARTTFENLDTLRQAKKIAVIGCSGSGKTYLTMKLHEQLQLPVYHLDQYAWKPGWEKVDFQELTKIHHDLCQQDAWIMEGIYFKLLQERVQAADVIIFLDISRLTCLYNVIKRAILHSGKVIDGNPQGCTQKMFSWKFVEFLQWIWNFNKKHRSAVLATLDACKVNKQVYILESSTEVNNFIQELQKEL